MNQPTLQQIKAAYSSKGYEYFEGTKPYNLNLWGIRKQYGDLKNNAEEVLLNKSELGTLSNWKGSGLLFLI